MNINQRVQELICNLNASQKALSAAISVPTSTLNNWIKLGRSIPSEYIIPICEFFNISTEYLLTGKEKSLPKLELNLDEQELLDNFNKLSEKSKGRLLEKAENLVELETKEKAEKENKPHIETVFMAARSSDHHPPEIVTGDFSDILNAPDATDEY